MIAGLSVAEAHTPDHFVHYTDEHVLVDRERGPVDATIRHQTRPTALSHAKTGFVQGIGETLIAEPLAAPCGYSVGRVEVFCLTPNGAFRPADEIRFLSRLSDAAQVSVGSIPARDAVLQAVAMGSASQLSSLVAPRVQLVDANRCRSACGRRVVVELMP